MILVAGQHILEATCTGVLPSAPRLRCFLWSAKMEASPLVAGAGITPLQGDGGEPET